MGCNCGRGGQVSSPVVPYPSAGWPSTQALEEYVVTYPTGLVEVFEDESAAYRALRLSGGGVQRRPKSA